MLPKSIDNANTSKGLSTTETWLRKRRLQTYLLIIPEDEDGLPDNDPVEANCERQSLSTPISAVTPGLLIELQSM